MSPIPVSPDPDEIAANLFLRRRSGDWTEADARDLEAWLDAAPLHRECFDSVERMWGAAGDVAGSPALRALRAEALAARPRGGRWSRRRFAAMAASLAVVVVAGGVGLMTQRDGGLAPAMERRAQVYRTAVGERATVTLADGSRLLLNTSSEVKVDYSGMRRGLELVSGEAWFDVAKDPSRPFVVSAGRHTVTAVGTSFDVRLEQAGLRVAVVEGRVAVDAVGRGRVSDVRAGERIDVDGETAVLRPSGPVAGDWREGRIEFASATLAEAAAEMNRYRRVPIVVTDPAVAKMRVSGVFYSGENSGFLDALPLTHPVSVQTLDDAIRIGPAGAKKTSSSR
jgi:transmembrane sensor